MTDPDNHSVGYQSYLRNKELHLSEARGALRGSFMKSASSSNFGTKIRTQEDPNDEVSGIERFKFETLDSVLPTLVVSPVDRKSEPTSDRGPIKKYSIVDSENLLIYRSESKSEIRRLQVLAKFRPIRNRLELQKYLLRKMLLGVISRYHSSVYQVPSKHRPLQKQSRNISSLTQISLSQRSQ